MTDNLAIQSTAVRSPREAVASLTSYDAHVPDADLMMAANESPYTLPESILAKLEAGIRDFTFRSYPDPTAQTLCTLIAQTQGVAPECVLVGNGGDELLLNLILAWGGPGRAMLNFPPTFSMYQVYADMLETQVISIPRDSETFAIDEDAALQALSSGEVDICFVTNPNNPSGTMTQSDSVMKLAEASNAILVVDEAYYDFSDVTVADCLADYPNLVILRTFSKAFSLAGMRLGYVMAHPEVIAVLEKVRMPYSVNAFSQWVGELAVTERNAFTASLDSIKAERARLFEALSALPGLKVWPSHANYLLFRLPDARVVHQRMLDRYRVYIRDFSRAPGMENCLRVSVGTPEQNDAFLTALKGSLK